MSHQFNYTMHYFRAFAIINIMLGHVMRDSSIIMSDYCKKMNTYICDTLFLTDTHYFVLISGYLFYLINKNTNILELYYKKLINIFVPYLLISGILISISYIKYAYSGVFLSYVNTPTSLYQLTQNIVNGTTQGQFWYLPFIFFVFLIAPFICRINRLSLSRFSCVCVFPYCLQEVVLIF